MSTKRLLLCGAIMMLFASLLAGCSLGAGGGQVALKPLGKDDKATIKVMYYDERMFYQDFGNLFLSKYPNIDVEVASTQGFNSSGKDYDEALADFIEEEKPDVLLLGLDPYEKYAADGKLYELDPVISQDKFDLDGMVPAVIDTIRGKSDGKLYGLAPTFNAQALYYNKTLFDKYGIDYPKDQMSWEDVLQLARRFPTDGPADQRVYGLSFNGDAYYLAFQIGGSKGLSYLDAENGKVTIDTDGWKNVFQLALDAWKSGAVGQPASAQLPPGPITLEQSLKRDPFVGGRAAMMIASSGMMSNLRQAKDYLKEEAPNWDVVTTPVDSQNPDIGFGISFNQIFAINAESPNLRAAWEFIKYVNGSDYARIASRTQFALLSRSGYMPDKDHHMEAFYKLKPSDTNSIKGYDKLPKTFLQTFLQMVAQETNAALDGSETVDEALKMMQDKGQEALLQAQQASEKQQAAGK